MAVGYASIMQSASVSTSHAFFQERVALLKYFLIDAFTDQRFAGNPCAVFLDADALDVETMQTMAREVSSPHESGTTVTDSHGEAGTRTQQLKLAVVQPEIKSHNLWHNVTSHVAAIRRAEAQVVVFPELSLTGYELDATPVDLSDERLEPLLMACGEANCVALTGAPITQDGVDYIAMVAITSREIFTAYRKVNLGDAESKRFSPGSGPELLEVDGWRLGLAICKDTGVVEHAAQTAALGIDAYVAGTVKHSHESDLQWDRAQRAAIAHEVWVAVSSFAGPTGGGFMSTAGRSAIWSPDGRMIASCGPETSTDATVVLTRRPPANGPPT